MDSELKQMIQIDKMKISHVLTHIYNKIILFSFYLPLKRRMTSFSQKAITLVDNIRVNNTWNVTQIIPDYQPLALQ